MDKGLWPPACTLGSDEVVHVQMEQNHQFNAQPDCGAGWVQPFLPASEAPAKHGCLRGLGLLSRSFALARS